MDLERIIQDEKETIIVFLKRVISEIKRSNNQYTMEFLDGVKLETIDYDFTQEQGEVIDRILADYEEKKKIKHDEVMKQFQNNLQNTENLLNGNKESEEKIAENNVDEEQHTVVSEENQEMIKIMQCIDMLENGLKDLQNINIEMYEQELESLNTLLQETNANIKEDIELATELNSKKAQLILDMTDKNRKNIERKIDEFSRTLTTYDEDYKVQKGLLEKERDLLSQYEKELEEKSKQGTLSIIEEKKLRSKIAYQNWAIEAYEEYLEFIEEEYITPLEDEINIQKEKQEKITNSAKQQLIKLKTEHEKRFGLSHQQDGQVLYSNVPEIEEITKKIEEVQIALNTEKKREITFEEVRKMVKEGVAPFELAAKLHELTKEFNNPEIEDKLGLNNGKVKDRSEEIEKIKTQIEEYSKRIEDPENYRKMDEQEADKTRIEELENEIANATAQIEEYEAQLLNIFIIPKLKKELKIVSKNKEYLQRHLELNIDEDVVKESYKRRIENLEKKEEALLEKIEKAKANKKLVLESKVKDKIKKLEVQIENNKLDISVIKGKKDQAYIVDEDKLEKDKMKLSYLKKELQEMEASAQDLTKVSVEDVKQVIIENYMAILEKEKTEKEPSIEEPIESYAEPENSEEEIEIEEPIESYEDAPKSLIEKIKSNSFIKKATKALATIVAGIVIIAGVKGLTDNQKNEAPDVIIEESTDEEIEEVEETVVQDLEEPTKDIPEENKEDNGKSTIESMQDDALSDIISKEGDAIVHSDVYSAANDENGLRVNDNTPSWENATPGGIYAIKGNENIKINLQEAEKYINEGYEIVSAFVNDGEIIGFDKLELTEGLGPTGKSR